MSTLAVPVSKSRRVTPLEITDTRRLQKYLLSLHPYYVDMQERWDFYYNSYMGGKNFTFNTRYNYLIKYGLENDDFYTARRKRAFYLNMCKHPINFYMSTLFREDPQFHTDDGVIESSYFTPFLENADMQGTPFNLFISNCARYALAEGVSYIFLDVTAPEGYESIVTEADRVNVGLRPFVTQLHPQNVTNWRHDRMGDLEEVVFTILRYNTEDDEAAWSTPIVSEYWWYSRDEFAVYNHRTQLIAQGPNPFKKEGQPGIIPLIPMYHIKVDNMIGESLLVDASDVNKTIYNWCSAIDESMFKQMFAQAVIKSKDKPSSIGVGTDWAIHLRPDRDEDFGYVAPPIDPIQIGWESIQKLSEYIYVLTGLKQIAQVIAGQYYNQSGIAKEWDFSEVEKMLSDKASNIEQAANRCLELYAMWHGKEYPEFYELSRNYTVSSISVDIDSATKAMSLELPPTAVGELKRKVIDKMLPGLTNATKDVIYEELKTSIDKAIDELSRQEKAKREADTRAEEMANMTPEERQQMMQEQMGGNQDQKQEQVQPTASEQNPPVEEKKFDMSKSGGKRPAFGKNL